MEKSLHELHKAMPEHLRDDPPHDQLGDQKDVEAPSSYENMQSRGRQFLIDVYGKDQSMNIEKALHTVSPRLGYYSVPLVYGGIYSDTSALSIREACVFMYMANMAVDTPKQAIGHIDSSRRQGVTSEELLNVGILVRSIAELYNVRLKHWESIMETVDSGEINNHNPYEL